MLLFDSTSDLTEAITVSHPSMRNPRCLRTALDKTTGITHKDSRFNPKAIRAQEMYGEVDPATGEWNTGTVAAGRYFPHNVSCVFLVYT